MTGVMQDITERKRAEAAAARLAAIVESSDDAVIGKDLRGIVTSWNHGAEKVFGYPAAEIVGQSITLLIPPQRQRKEKKFFSGGARGRGQPFKGGAPARERQPRRFPVKFPPIKEGRERKIGGLEGGARHHRAQTL